MKKRIMIFLAGSFFILILAGTGCDQGGKDWAAKIDGHKLPLQDFNDRWDMYMQLYSSQPEAKSLTPQEEKQLKEELLKSMIGEYLVYEELKSEGFQNTPEGQEAVRQALINLYLQTKFGPEITVSQAEIDMAYNQNRERYRNMDPDYAAQSIQYQLAQQKFEMKTSEIIDRLYGRAKIEKNEEALVSLTIPQIDQEGAIQAVPRTDSP